MKIVFQQVTFYIQYKIFILNVFHAVDLLNYTSISGDILPVTSKPFDLRTPKTMASLLAEIPEGVDHNFCIKGDNNIEKEVARYFNITN